MAKSMTLRELRGEVEEEQEETKQIVPDMGATFSQTDEVLDTTKAKPKATTLKALRGEVEEDEEAPLFEDGSTLRKKDLKVGSNADDIRNYMVDRFGVDYNTAGGKSNDEVVEDFIDHMRYVSGNVVSVAGEARYMTNADDGKRARADKAFTLYDRMGNVFINDGFTGAVDGILDYMGATLTDPSTYIGLLTGGVGKASGVGLTQAGRETVRQMALAAGRRAAASATTKEAAKTAGEAAAKRAAERFAAASVSSAESKAVRAAAARMERDIFMREAKKKAQRDALKAASSADAKKVLLATTALDSTFAVMHDVTLQNTMLTAGSQEQYSLLQTGFSSLLGGVGGLAQLGFGKFKGSSGLTDTDIKLKIGAQRNEAMRKVDEAVENIKKKRERVPVETSDDVAKEAAKIIRDEADLWIAKVARGKDQFDDVPTSVDFLKNVMVGEDSKGGLVKLYKDNGVALPKGTIVSDVMTSLVQKLPQEQLDVINKQLKPMGINLGETSQVATSLGDLLAVEISKSGQVLNVMSQVRKSIDAALLYGDTVLNKQVDVIDAVEEEIAKADRAKVGQYGQSLWRRLLVSAPETTMANVYGFTTYYGIQTMADLLSSTGHIVYGLSRGGMKTEAGREAFRVARVYGQLQAQKMRNFLDPYTTHDAYMAVLEQNKDLSKVLYETFAGGTQRSAKRFNINPENKAFQVAETVASTANRVTGVTIQDTWTKSQMFIGEMDKWLRLNKNTTLQEALETGNIKAIDDQDVISNSLDTTLKSVFSKDYTADDSLLKEAAKLTEGLSNTPILGTLLPFGRFFNNVVATTYQLGAGGVIDMVPALYKKGAKGTPIPKTASEAFARTTVAWTGALMAMQYDEERRDKGLDTFQVDAGGNNIIDVKNVWPFSAFLAVGRTLNLYRKGEQIPRELKEDLLQQVAIGQLASDAQFGNDLYNIADIFLSKEDGSRSAGLDELYKKGGNFLAGFTRPLSAINRMVGLINNSDAARDQRQQTGIGVGIMGATKYVDNIIEIFSDKLDSVTGEELRVATREGSLRDVNPIMNLLGIKLMPARTATEKVYSMAQAHPWQANERSQIPAYDRVFNKTIAPILEKRYLELVDSEKFRNASVAQRRIMLTGWKNVISTELRNYLKESPEGGLYAAQRKATTVANKNARHEAMKHMREKYDFSGSGPRDMNWEELQLFIEVAEYYKDINTPSKVK